MLRWTLRTLSLVSLTASLLSGYLFYQLYWKWRERFNENGLYQDEWTHLTYYEQSGLIWGSITTLLLIMALMLDVLGIRSRRNK